jgi:L-threonylcarbamoyladenylate synthase
VISRLPAGEEGIAQAANALARGELVAFPTETVYGLGANACDDAAVAQIFAAKGRPQDHPLIVHVQSAAQVAVFAADVPSFAKKLMDAHWPGPLTLILPRREGVAAASAGGQRSIGLRCPAHPIAQALLEAALAASVKGVSAPSANPFGRISPTTAEHVATSFADAPQTIHLLDGGACDVGIESSIVDCTRGEPILLRPGVLTVEELSRSAGQSVRSPSELGQAKPAAPKASGTLEQHYAPRAKLRIMSAQQIQTALDVLGSDAPALAAYARAPLRSSSPKVMLRRMPDRAREAAFELFAALHAFDAAAVQLIWVEAPPESADWDGVRDRLQRAAA